MRDLPIELLGSPLLRQRAADVTVFDEALRDFIHAMYRTMYRANGQGLAAPQVGVLQRVVVIDLPDEDIPACTLVNPVIVSRGARRARYEEGCLSIPGVTASVERDTQVVVEAQDINGRPFVLEATDLLADCVQHELDHLDGVLYIDHLSYLQREIVLRRYRKQQRRNA